MKQSSFFTALAISLTLCAFAFGQEKLAASVDALSGNFDEATKRTIANKLQSTLIEKSGGKYTPVGSIANSDIWLKIYVTQVFDTTLIFANLVNSTSKIVEATGSAINPLKSMPDLTNVANKIAEELLNNRNKYAKDKPTAGIYIASDSEIAVAKALEIKILEHLALSGGYNLVAGSFLDLSDLRSEKQIVEKGVHFGLQYFGIGEISSVFGTNSLSIRVNDVKTGTMIRNGEENLRTGEAKNNSQEINNLIEISKKIAGIMLRVPMSVFKDSRDSKTYSVWNIGGATWFLNDLKYNNEGGYYDWYGAMNSCPSGWRLPNENDWKKLHSKTKDNYALKEEFGSAGYRSNWWSATEGTAYEYLGNKFTFKKGGFNDEYKKVPGAKLCSASSCEGESGKKSDKNEVRCVKD